VNGSKINQPVMLKPGDKINIGDTLFVVEGKSGHTSREDFDTIHRLK